MNYIADLHIHSPYSRATSPGSTLPGLAGWAGIKGIKVIASGDLTHPAWLKKLKEELTPAEPGLFRLKEESRIVAPLPGLTSLHNDVRFILSAEVSCIYKRHSKTRKIHNLLYLPDFDSAQRLNSKLGQIGNMASDGRPMLALDSRDLLEMLLESSPEGFMVPAHIWTPWFSLLGSKSGFDSVEECFGDLTDHIFALETGLSSDPYMNRMISGLDRYALISNSDCHSPQKLGREANLLSTGLDYYSLRDAIRTNRSRTFPGTVEFFPEEGKYHYDGHRGCNICLSPIESRELSCFQCPVCSRPLTIGVEHRIMDLADRTKPISDPEAPRSFHLIPLHEILGELTGLGPTSKNLLRQYCRAIQLFGSELDLLLHCEIDDIKIRSPLLAMAVDRVRSGQVTRIPGFDGKYGSIKVFRQGELQKLLKPQSGMIRTSRSGHIDPFIC